MANDVFANGREVACKSGDGKSICAFPDVCMTPPENPATPPGVPVPYPNTGFARDTTEGSRSVRISGKEVMLKNKSYFKKSTGDEAGCAAKKGVITSTNRGKVYFIAWSDDVKIEGENAVRHLDLTTHNHASPTANEAAPMAYVDSSAFGKPGNCDKDRKDMKAACGEEEACPGVLGVEKKEHRAAVEGNPTGAFAEHAALIKDLADAGKSRTERAAAAGTAKADTNKCVQESRCYLRPYDPSSGQDGCCPGQTGHHIPPQACFKGNADYSHSQALCVCLEGMNQHCGSHGKNHAAIDWLAKEKKIAPGDPCSRKDYNALCAATVEAQFGCDKKCIEEQLNQQFEKISDVKHAPSKSNVGVSDKEKDSIRKSAELPLNPTDSE